MSYEKPTFTNQEVSVFENTIDKYILKGYCQLTLSTGIVDDDMARFQTYLSFYYPSGTYSTNPNFRNYRIAKNGKKYAKKENW